MNNIEEVIASLKRRIDFHSQAMDHMRESEDLNLYNAHSHEKEQLIAILHYLQTSLKDKQSNDSLYIKPDDLVGLPDELIEQLGLSESDKQDFFLMEVIGELGGVASIDKIIIKAYKKNNEILERQKLSAKLYRMLSKGLIYPLPNKKGVYSLKPITEEEERNLEN